jgi:peroxiredoxin
LFARLRPVADLLGYDADWRLPRAVPSDVGFRPALDTLGPFRWSPSPAPSWSLVDANNTEIGSQDFLGRPYIIIFYLGHGCLHCAEQLEAFGPRLGDFEAAGIEFVAISSDDREGLTKSIEQYNGVIPFKRLVSDEKLKVFKSFRAYDDFEQQPLHGTFLIDSRGLIRWQDISYQPFMDHEFLLHEAQRLLQQSEPSREITGHASRLP